MHFSGAAATVIAGGSGLTVTADGNNGLPIDGVFGANIDTHKALETWLKAMDLDRTFGATAAGTAAAGNKAIVELNNPAASGRVIFIYDLDFWTATAMAFQIVLDGTTITPAGTGKDLKIGGAVSQGLIGGSNQLAPAGTNIYTTPQVAVNVLFTPFDPWFLAIPSGHNMQVIAQTVNTAFTCNVRWMESSS